MSYANERGHYSLCKEKTVCWNKLLYSSKETNKETYDENVFIESSIFILHDDVGQIVMYCIQRSHNVK